MLVVTGCAGFIGSWLCDKLLSDGHTVHGIDNINDYYDKEIKNRRINKLCEYPNFFFHKEDIRDTELITKLKPSIIYHLAGMAGVRFSLKNPKYYADVNILGFINLLEQAKCTSSKIIYASSSSVYGRNQTPFKETDPINTINSPYAASKFSMDIYAQTYCQLYDMTVIGLRFFTVYGPDGRVDMAPYKFLKAIMHGTELTQYGDGTSTRDYTYIDDIVDGIILAGIHGIHHNIYNLGNSTPVSLNNFIALCENVIGKKANINKISDQAGDVPNTHADITRAQQDLGFCPKIPLREGLEKTYKWISEMDK